ncbi:MAG: hypothetical protein ACRC9I_02640 [Acinetobacter sp.]
MNTLGLRVSPKEITFCVFDLSNNNIVNLEEICVPNALEIPEKLKYIRATLLDVLREYDIQKAGIKLTEPNAQKISIERVQIEGVIQETFASSMLKAYYQGPLATISSKLDMNKTALKELINESVECDFVLDWNDYKEKEREAIVVAIGARNV